MINLALNNQVNNINIELSNLGKVLLNCSVLLYKKVVQKSLSYAPFDNATVDYTYAPSYLEYDSYFTQNQIQVVLQYYTDKVDSVIALIIATGIESQFNQKINELNISISNLSDFALALYNGQNNRILMYTTQFGMSIRTALLLNGFTLNNLPLVMLFNMSNINTINYIDKGVELILL